MCIKWFLISDNLIKTTIEFLLNLKDYSLNSTLTFLPKAPCLFENAPPPPPPEPKIQHQSDFLSPSMLSEAPLTLVLFPNLESIDRVLTFA